MGGCAVNKNDIHRWEKTERGPDKLAAVVAHDKYNWELRKEAAFSLVRMEPRGGRRIGLDLLLSTLLPLPPATQTRIIADMTPELVHYIILQPPPPPNKEGATIDPSISFKDAAFALLSHDPAFTLDEETQKQLRNALIRWIQTDFENRENKPQQFGMEQMVRSLGSDAVNKLPDLINEECTKIERVISLIADHGTPDVKAKASAALVRLEESIESDQWLTKQTPIVQQANEQAKVHATPEQLKQQLTKYQDQETTRIFSAMKRLGGRSVIEYTLKYAADSKKPEERRKAALAALEGHIDKNYATDANQLFEIAKADSTPDAVRDLAFVRLGEFPKEMIVPRLYSDFFPMKNWKLRWLAGSLILKSISVSELPEFFNKLPVSASTKIGMSEPLTYGAAIAKMEAVPHAATPRDIVLAHMNDHSLGAKLTAMGFFYHGKKSDLSILQPYGEKRDPLPKCGPADECGWVCEIPKPGSEETEAKPLSTVGDFVRYCIVPSIAPDTLTHKEK
ncbi:hypothetical protein [Pajaroellobacter abortibovis]|nr:hypothetical protein [Pajaroellobacter abortibovis]